MPSLIATPEPKPIKQVRVQVGDEWISESTSRPMDPDEIRSRALSMIERLVPRRYG